MHLLFAMGALYRRELPANDPVATEYLVLSKAAMVQSSFMFHNTIQCVQAPVCSSYGECC